MVDKVINFTPCDSIETIFKVSKESYVIPIAVETKPSIPLAPLLQYIL